jgi:hypothetical protein
MKRSTFTDSQIVEAIKFVEGAGSAAPSRELGISSAKFCKWRSALLANAIRTWLVCASNGH